MNKPIEYYEMLNKYQVVKFYTKEEIEAYKLTKPMSFFLIPTKKEIAYEIWVDLVMPKTGVYESQEAKLIKKLINKLKGLNNTYSCISQPNICTYSYIDLLNKLKND